MSFRPPIIGAMRMLPLGVAMFAVALVLFAACGGGEEPKPVSTSVGAPAEAVTPLPATPAKPTVTATTTTRPAATPSPAATPTAKPAPTTTPRPTASPTLVPTAAVAPPPTHTLGPTPTPTPAPAATGEEFFLHLEAPDRREVVVTLDTVTVVGRTRVDAVVTVNDDVVEPDLEGRFQQNVSLKPGANTIEVIASLASGEQKSIIVTAIYLP